MTQKTPKSADAESVSEKTPPAGSNRTGEEDFTKDSLKSKIGKNLQQLYDDVLNEPVPNDFLTLLDQADKSKD